MTKPDPRVDPPSPTDPDITPDEERVLSLMDGQRSVGEIAELSGMEEMRAQGIVDDLVRRGVVDMAGEGEGGVGDDGFGGLLLVEDDEPVDASLPASHEPSDEPSQLLEEARAEEATSDAIDAEDAEAESAGAEDAVSAADEERNYRKMFETKFRALAPDARVALASRASGEDLCALCLDPDPKVIAAILANATFGFAQARLIAFHHRTPTGLDHIASRNDLVRDGLVLRRLIRNPMLAAATFRRLMQSRRLLELYKVSNDREIPRAARTSARGLLRARFASQAQPDERAALIVTTEGRVLQMLSGCTFDARTTQILCGRQVYSAMFIQNVARFGASPPVLLAHLAKLPFVRRNPGLKKALMQHPNMPGDVKRSL